MATIGHLAAGIALARAGERTVDLPVMAAVAAAAAAPDLDLLIGINHRGPTHSIGFAAILGIITFVAFRIMGHRRPMLVGALAAAAVLSHIVLDLLTVHSPVAALWPFTTREFVLTVVLLPSIPLDDRITTIGGLLLSFGELVWSMVLVALAFLVPRRDPAAR